MGNQRRSTLYGRTHACSIDNYSNILDNNSIMKEETNEQSINERIARRVRALRSARGISLEGLAAKSDVSRSMISLIERGESSATAVVLEKIATGLGMTLAALFADSEAPVSPVAREAERTVWRDPQSGYLRRNISPPTYPSPIQIVEVVLPPGAYVAYETGAREIHIHQQIWVQSGLIMISLGEQTYQLEAGDCLAMELNTPTAFRNSTEQPARYIVVIATEQGRR
jgi:transcriptional regulator with XRE-family HTH domain